MQALPDYNSTCIFFDLVLHTKECNLYNFTKKKLKIKFNSHNCYFYITIQTIKKATEVILYQLISDYVVNSDSVTMTSKE